MIPAALMSPVGLLLMAAAVVLLFMLLSPKKSPPQSSQSQPTLPDWFRLQAQAEPLRPMKSNRELETEADADLIRDYFLRTEREEQEAAALERMAKRLAPSKKS